jgi:hypothetical protein
MPHGNSINTGWITDFSRANVQFRHDRTMPRFRLLGYEGSVSTAEQRSASRDVDDASHLVMRTIDYFDEAIVGSVVTDTGQVMIWCQTIWIAASPPAYISSPEMRLRDTSPGASFRRVTEDDVMACGMSARIDSFLCTWGGAVHVSSRSEVGYTFSHWGLESVVILPRSLPR